MVEHLSQAARRVVGVAEEEARLLGHGSVGTGHLLLGLLVVDDDGFTANLLWGCDLTVDVVRRQVAELTGDPSPEAPATMKLNDGAKRSVQLARRVAMEHGRPVGTDHLLLGVIELGEGIAVRVLEASAIDLANLKAAVVAAQGMARSPGPPLASDGQDEEADFA